MVDGIVVVWMSWVWGIEVLIGVIASAGCIPAFALFGGTLVPLWALQSGYREIKNRKSKDPGLGFGDSIKSQGRVLA